MFGDLDKSLAPLSRAEAVSAVTFAVVGGTLAIAAYLVWIAWIMMLGYAWFLEPITGVSINLAWAFGLVVLIDWCVHNPPEKNRTPEETWRYVRAHMIRDLTTLALMYFAHLVI